MPTDSLPVLYETETWIAVCKPHGMLVHRTGIAAEPDAEYALQIVRKQLGNHTRLYPAHRLDRKTYGILIFAKSKTVVKKLQAIWQQPTTVKTYRAIVRGWLTEPDGTIDYALTNDRGTLQNAVTHYKVMNEWEIDLPSRHHPTSRLSELELYPETGRFHQIRKHLAHIHHPIIGDRPHGCNKTNKIWKETYGMDTMMLMATNLQFSDMVTYQIEAPLSEAYHKVLKLINDKKLE